MSQHAQLASIADHLFADETECLHALTDIASAGLQASRQTHALARQLVEAVRKGRRQRGGIDEFMQEYALSSQEGVMLMCLAEALLRIPDAHTADKLIADKISGKDWQDHLGHSDSLFVNASTWGLMLTGQVLQLGHDAGHDVSGYLNRLIGRSGEPVIRRAMRHAMRIMGRQFVLGRTITEALSATTQDGMAGFRFSFDMLGEAAMTMADADGYFQSYAGALGAVAAHARAHERAGPGHDVFAAPSLSVKLSALHPRYEAAKPARINAELVPRLMQLAVMAKTENIGLTIDAEEADRLEISLKIFAKLASAPELAGWNGLGLAVQAYSRRARPVIIWLEELARQTGRKIPVRLVKGAYWDTEIKRAQEQGLASYPVFTRKISTDVSYLACARLMLKARDVFYPQFATHNAQSLAAIVTMAGDDDTGYEFQRLHGMGQALYNEVIAADGLNRPCRIYAPVGSHEDLLAYLVRRLLENGANSSFVNRLADDEAPIREIIADPVEAVRGLASVPNPHIAAPCELFSPRANSQGIALWDNRTRSALLANINAAAAARPVAMAIIDGKPEAGLAAHPLKAPHDHAMIMGHVHEAGDRQIARAMASAADAQHDWDRAGGAHRAQALEKAADIYEQDTARLLALLMGEAGKTLDNALSDLREAVDFLRYYAERAREDFSGPETMAGPTGERNEVSLHGRGVFASIAPWNFPLAIFTGQVAAALAAGNTVIAKPAEQTPLIAFEAVKILHRAGVPGAALQLLPGDGSRIGKHLLASPELAGVAFTGSNDTAAIINRALARRDGPIVPFIAETGGMNAMIVDSSALPEQAVRDVLASAFDSAGQRCSAARILFVQDDIADRVITMTCGAMAELAIGNPFDFATDVGPVIDAEAKKVLEAHKQKMKAAARRTLIDLKLPKECENGTFVAPAAYELDDISDLEREVFGPVLHVVRYGAGRIDQVCDAINATGFGLTAGLHTRIESVVDQVRARLKVGNMYVNRNQIGAVVGAQPFGGERLSGTGPKAGGPRYLNRFAVERAIAIDTTASGGNAALMSLEPQRSNGPLSGR